MIKKKCSDLQKKVSNHKYRAITRNNDTPEEKSTEHFPATIRKMPGLVNGMTLQKLRDDYKERIFRQYLPFWDKGGYDSKYGGFMCELNNDGSVRNDEKYIWYQGRGIWVYSYLYNNFGKNEQYLDVF